VLAAALIAAAGGAGCGSDDDIGDGGGGSSTETTATATGPKTDIGTTPEKPPPTEPRTTDVPPPSGSPSPSPEDEPGGGGDEEPARTEVMLTASGRSVRPRSANVAPYISVRLTFASKGPGKHTLSIGGEKLVAGADTPPVTITLDGLRPGESYTGRLSGGGSVRIVAASEPGP
jgi:hypothetical protein